MCIPKQFINDNPYNPDCLDSSDEDDYHQDVETPGKWLISLYENGVEYPNCYQDPSFRCEESNHRLKLFTLSSICGDGQPDVSFLPHKIGKRVNDFGQDRCHNKRVQIIEESLVSKESHPNLSYECWFAMMCITYLFDYKFDDECNTLLWKWVHNDWMSIKNICNQSDYVIFPAFPILEGHVRLGYWTNKTFEKEFGAYNRMPDFICYDARRCSFLSFTMKIDNLTCIEESESFHILLEELPILFRTCNQIYESGNETHCIHPSLFHCPGTSKCISKHRLLDRYADCYNDTDESYENSCQLNDQHRFRCTSVNKCVPRYVIRNGFPDCLGSEDEMPTSRQQNISFQKLCNGYTSLNPIFIDEKNETDETNCEQWPCNNQYSRCDGAWGCPNGADEINCDKNSKCYPNSHECISPITYDIICLPLNRAGNGIIDCLGATDEREYCRQKWPLDVLLRYRCSDDITCDRWKNSPYSKCLDTQNCETEVDFFFNKFPWEGWMLGPNCTTHSKMMSVLNQLEGDHRLIDNHNLNQTYFTLDYSNQLSSNIEQRSLPKLNQPLIPLEKFDFVHNSICHRGIFIGLGKEKMNSCLCPPSYYGNQCQFQSQRISLTLKIGKECAPNCRGVYAIVLTLIDLEKMIHSYEQLTYITTRNCDIKYNLYFLYGSRPKDLTKNYSIHIDIYDRVDLSYYISWIIPIRLVFLPVNRISVHVIIPSHPIGIIKQCPFTCGNHGHCRRYINTGKYFCHCHSGWSGIYCNIEQNKCNCSSSSICMGIVNNRSICLCPLDKFGSRCFLSSVCQDNPCQNNGQCIPADDRLSRKSFYCFCPAGYVGDICEKTNMGIHISFQSIEISQIIFIYLITVQNKSDPLITTIAKKISSDEDRTTVYTSIPFNMIYIQIQSDYYLTFLQINATHRAHTDIVVKSSSYCTPIDKLLDKRTATFPVLRRAKYYHTICKKQPHLTCFHDRENFMCLCNKDRHANCLQFDFEKKSICLGRAQCEHDGYCIPDISICPTSTMCICTDCYYGTKCQLTTKGFGLSLDLILGYQIRPYMSIPSQRIAVKISIAVTQILMFIGYVSGILSTLTFRSKNLREVGCGFYLFTLSIVSIFTVTIFTLKLWLLIAFQTLWITNRTAQKISCISVEFLLQSLMVIENWLGVCISIERALLVITRY